MKPALVFLATAAILLSPYAARAADTSLGASPGSAPLGITVNVSASVTPLETVQNIGFAIPAGQSFSQIRDRLTATGIPSDAIENLPGMFGTGAVSVRIPPAKVAGTLRVLKAARAVVSGTVAVPADYESAYAQAETLAVQKARVRAQAVASAANEHLGRLINFQPNLAELAREMVSQTPMGLFSQPNSVTVTVNAMVTFEVLP